jgi:hypothetical protein
VRVDVRTGSRHRAEDVDASHRSRRREPADVAALAVHIMVNTALTGATYEIDGGQQLIPS